MVDPVSLGLGITVSALTKNAPAWFSAIKETLLGKGRDVLMERGQERVQDFLDARKCTRHIELALQNAVERGIKCWNTHEERRTYREIINLLAESHSDLLPQEALRLFTLSDQPDFALLNEKYNLSQRLTAISQQRAYTEVDTTSYLSSFFEALVVELYNDPLFRSQIGESIKMRALAREQRTLTDILAALQSLAPTSQQSYTIDDLRRDIEIYTHYIEGKFRYHKFAGIILRGDEDRSPEIDNIFVPLRMKLQERPVLRHVEEEDDNLLTLLEWYDYVVALGKPGSGKSTTASYLTWSHARANLELPAIQQAQKQSVLPGRPVPLNIELRLFSELRKQNSSLSFITYLTDVVLKQADIHVSPLMFKMLLERRAMLIILDGLDEVPTLAERRRLIDEIENFAQNYPGNRILITSRPVGYDIARFTDPLFVHSELQDLNDEQLQQFLNCWYAHVLKYPVLPPEIQRELDLFLQTIVNNPRLHTLAGNPLLLTVMTALHRYERLPDERVQIYERCADLLLDTWARLKYEGTKWRDIKMGKQDQLACIAHLGFVLHQRSQEATQDDDDAETGDVTMPQDGAVDVPKAFMLRQIQRFLAEQNLLSGAEQHAEAERFLELVRVEAGLVVARGTDETGETLYGFVHRTFQEYFAAVDVLERYQQEEDSSIISAFLREHVHDPHWQEVILLLLGKLKHKIVTRQLRKILEGKSRRSKYHDLLQQDLFFVATCLADGIRVENDFAVDIINRLEHLAITAPFPSQQEEAIDALGRLLRAKQYAEASKQILKRFLAPEQPLTIARLAAEAFYDYCPEGTSDKSTGSKAILKRLQKKNLDIEAIAALVQALYECSPHGSDELLAGTNKLLASLESEEVDSLSFKEQMALVALIYLFYAHDAKEMRKVSKFVLESLKNKEPSLEELEDLGKLPVPFKLFKRADIQMMLSLFLARMERLTVREQVKFAKVIRWFINTVDGRQTVASMLFTRLQEDGVPIDEQILLAEAIYYYIPVPAFEKQEAYNRLHALAKRDDLPIAHRIQAAEAFYATIPEGSEEECEGAELFLALLQREDVTIEQQITLASAIYYNMPTGDRDEFEGYQMLMKRLRDDDLSLRQQALLAEAIYTPYPLDSDAHRYAWQRLVQLARNEELMLEERLRLAVLSCQYNGINFTERLQAIHLLTEMLGVDMAREYLGREWEDMPLALRRESSRRRKAYVIFIPEIFELAHQEVLSIEERDPFFKLLYEMVPLFGSEDGEDAEDIA